MFNAWINIDISKQVDWLLTFFWIDKLKDSNELNQFQVFSTSYVDQTIKNG